MPTALAKFYGFAPFALFDGTNAADVVSTFNTTSPSNYTGACTAALISTGTGTCTIRFTDTDDGLGPRDVILNTGECIPLNANPYPVPASTLNWRSTVLATGGPAAAVRYGGFGEALIGALSVGSQNIAVTIKPTQPDTNYVANAFLDGPALSLGNVSLGTPVKTSASVVTVPVINSGLLPVTLSTSTVSVNVTAPQS